VSLLASSGGIAAGKFMGKSRYGVFILQNASFEGLPTSTARKGWCCTSLEKFGGCFGWLGKKHAWDFGLKKKGKKTGKGGGG
jgi:hypothetical protein